MVRRGRLEACTDVRIPTVPTTEHGLRKCLFNGISPTCPFPIRPHLLTVFWMGSTRLSLANYSLTPPLLIPGFVRQAWVLEASTPALRISTLPHFSGGTLAGHFISVSLSLAV